MFKIKSKKDAVMFSEWLMRRSDWLPCNKGYFKVGFMIAMSGCEYPLYIKDSEGEMETRGVCDFELQYFVWENRKAINTALEDMNFEVSEYNGRQYLNEVDGEE